MRRIALFFPGMHGGRVTRFSGGEVEANFLLVGPAVGRGSWGRCGPV